MTTALLSPYQEQDVVELSRTLFRKKLLPLGSINYKGKKITFDQKFLADLAQSFKDGAYDQVAFQLADTNNNHTLDPERFRGEVKALELTSDGLDVLVETTPEGAELIRKNPKLGVSARILLGYERSDGKKFARAIQHVLGTLDPRVPGLGPWQEVALANEDEVSTTIDATTEEVKPLSDTSGTQPPGAGGSSPAPAGGSSSTATATPPRGTSADPQPVMDIENIDDLDFDLDDVTDEDIEAVAASLSNPVTPPQTLDLNTSSGSEPTAELQRIRQLELSLARSEFRNEAQALIRDGVPPVLVELARPILELPQAPVIDLSNGESPVDVGSVLRAMLHQSKGLIELARERGSSEVREPEVQDEETVLKHWEEAS